MTLLNRKIPPSSPAIVALRIELGSLRRENVELTAENERLRKAVDRLGSEKIGVIVKHGECTEVLEKFTRRLAVVVFCRKLRREALALVR